MRPSIHPRAFSLVELLIVISILALLVALLLPSLGRAKDQARLVECLSRIRQCAVIGMGAYGADNSDAILPNIGIIPGLPFLPGGISYNILGGAGHAVSLSPYVGNSYNASWADFMQSYLQPSRPRQDVNGFEYSNALYCAADFRGMGSPSNTRVGWWGQGRFREFSWRSNYAVTPVLDHNKAQIGRKMGTVRKPSSKVYQAEVHYEAVSWYGTAFFTVEPPFGWGPQLLDEFDARQGPATEGPDFDWVSPRRHQTALAASYFDASAKAIPFSKRNEFIGYINPNLSDATFGTGPNWGLD